MTVRPASSSPAQGHGKINLLICAGLLLAVAVLYAPLLHCGFVNLDDYDYIKNNYHVREGFTWPDILWCFKPGYASNWHPLTWLSHMLDCQLFDLNAGGHHLVNILLHGANSILVFFLFLRLTAKRWPSALVALLFAIHPLHVESVAWVSERKDVLSTFFEMLTMLIYVKYAKANIQHSTSNIQRPTFYFLSLFFFACALMSKPMVVTLPFLLLLLDWWPLKRIADCGLRIADWKRPVIEKLPFFLLSAVACKLTLVAQVKSITWNLPMALRFSNAMRAYVLYLGKMVWPGDLSVYYPYTFHWPAWEIPAAVTFLVLTSALAVGMARSRPWFLFGWLWYLGVLAPHIGLVQAGSQAMADRDTYVSLLGIFVILIWGANDLIRDNTGRKLALAGLVVILSSFAVWTHIQVGYWKDTVALMARAVGLAQNNFFALTSLGDAYSEIKNYRAATIDYDKALRILPDDPRCNYHIGNVLCLQGRYEESLPYYDKALSVPSPDPRAYYDLGNTLAMLHQFKGAETNFLTAIHLDADLLSARINLATVRILDGRVEDGMAGYRDVLTLAPHNNLARFLLAHTLGKENRWAEAAQEYRRCLEFHPKDVEAMNDLAWILSVTDDARLRDLSASVQLAEKACHLTLLTNAGYLDTLAVAYAQTGRYHEAKKITEKAIGILTQAKQTRIVEGLTRRLELYEKGLPYRPEALQEEPISLKKSLDEIRN